MENPDQEITISPEEARAFVDKLNADGEVTREKRDAWALVATYSFWEDKIENDERFGEDDILKAHNILAKNIPRIAKGEYSKNSRRIRHSENDVVHFPPPEQVPELMKKFSAKMEQYMRFVPEDPEQITRVIDHAAELMVDFVSIHPFGDGNGRMSRLIADGVLVRGGLYKMPHWLDPEAGDFVSQRKKFFNSIRVAEQGDPRLLRLFFVQQQLSALKYEEESIQSNTQARIEANTSGYTEERITHRNILEGYEEALVESIELQPPSFSPQMSIPK